MITHACIKMALHGQEETLWRELYVPTFLYLNDLATIINLCFGWPTDTHYTFTDQNSESRYCSEQCRDLSSPKAYAAEATTLQTLFEKSQSVVYRHSASSQAQIDLSLKIAVPLLLPVPSLQLKRWQGDTVPSPTGGTVMLQEDKVQEGLLQLQNVYFADYFSDEPNGEGSWQGTKDVLLDNLLHELTQDMPEEDAMQLLEKLRENIEAETSRVYTLQQCLDSLYKDDLLDIARFNHFRGYSKLRRDQLIDFLQERLLRRDFVQQAIATFTLPEATCLMRLCQGNLPIFSSDSYRNLTTALSYGLCYTDSLERLFILPQELKALVQDVLEDEDVSFSLYLQDIVYTCCFTAVYLFGIYPAEKLLQRVQEALEIPFSMNDLQNLAMVTERSQQEYALFDGYLVDKLFLLPEEENHLAALKKMQQSSTKPVFWPDLDTMVQLADEGWLISEELYNNFAESFETYLSPQRQDMAEVMRMTEHLIRAGYDFSSIATLLSKDYFHFSDSKLYQQFVSALQQIWNETPMWFNNGFSPNQLRKQLSKSKTDNVISLTSHRKKKKK